MKKPAPGRKGTDKGSLVKLKKLQHQFSVADFKIPEKARLSHAPNLSLASISSQKSRTLSEDSSFEDTPPKATERHS